MIPSTPDWVSGTIAVCNLCAAIWCAHDRDKTLMWLNLFGFVTNLICAVVF